MNQRYSQISDSSTIRFKRYSRNAYAVFASIGKNITIGALKSYISDAQLKKESGKNPIDFEKKPVTFSEITNEELENISLEKLQLITTCFLILPNLFETYTQVSNRNDMTSYISGSELLSPDKDSLPFSFININKNK